MSQYAYCTTDILSGSILSASLPVNAQNFGRTIGMAGTFTGALELGAKVQARTLAAWLAAVEPWKSVLWCLQDQQPIWCGPITGWPHQSITSGDLPIAASTMEALFQCRQISDTLVFKNEDVFTIFRALAQYAMDKTPNGQVANLNLGSNLSGITDSITFDGSQLQKVYDAWTMLVTEYPIEYSIRPALAPGDQLVMYLDLGSPSIGRGLAESGLQLTFPGNVVLDYGFPRVAQQGPANVVVASASTATATYLSKAPAGVVEAELAGGYPLLEDSVSITGLSSVSQAAVNATATAQAGIESVTAMATPVVKLGAEGFPKVSQMLLGDWTGFAATSPLHPANAADGGPGLMLDGRIMSWSLYPPGPQQTEATWYTLGETQPVAA